MNLLQQRIEIARDAPERVRLFVLETALLPRQRATLPVPDSVVREIQEEIAACAAPRAVIGTTDDCVGEVARLHSHGVAVDLVNSLTYGDGDCVIDLVGARKFEFDELLTDEPGYTEASVRWIDNGDDEAEDGWDRAVAQEKCGDLERLLLGGSRSCARSASRASPASCRPSSTRWASCRRRRSPPSSPSTPPPSSATAACATPSPAPSPASPPSSCPRRTRSAPSRRRSSTP